MSYQTNDHSIGTVQNLELILNNIDSSAKIVTDIGCNQGIIPCALALHGFETHGIEQQEGFINYGINKARTENIKNTRFTKAIIDFKNIEIIDGSDVILLLSVHHQMVKSLGINEGNRLLKEIFKRANKQFFFQPATIYEKYGCEMPWAENDLNAIESYFIDLFKSVRNFEFINLGVVDNRLPNSEPLRPLYMFNFEQSKNSKISIPKSPFEFHSNQNEIVRIPLEKCRGHYWQSFADDSWHFMREQVKQLKNLNRSGQSLDISETVLFQYCQSFAPQTFKDAADLLGIPSSNMGILGDQATKRYQSIDILNPVITNEFRSLTSKDQGDLMPSADAYHCGPRSKDEIMKEINRLNNIYSTLAKGGYKPNLHADGYIRGHFITLDSDWVFLCTAGAHRLSAIAELDYKWITARLQPGRPNVLNLNDLKNIPAVKNGAILESELISFNSPYFTNHSDSYKKFILN